MRPDRALRGPALRPGGVPGRLELLPALEAGQAGGEPRRQVELEGGLGRGAATAAGATLAEV